MENLTAHSGSTGGLSQTEGAHWLRETRPEGSDAIHDALINACYCGFSPTIRDRLRPEYAEELGVGYVHFPEFTAAVAVDAGQGPALRESAVVCILSRAVPIAANEIL